MSDNQTSDDLEEAKPKPKHPNANFKQIELSEDQKLKLNQICNDPAFLNGVQGIAEEYILDQQFCKQIPTKAEQRDEIKNLGEAAYKMSRMLGKFRTFSESQLYKVSGDIRTAEECLQRIFYETINFQRKDFDVKKESGKKRENYSATRSLKRLFDTHNLTWNANTWDDATCHAIDALEIIFKSGGFIISRSTIADIY
tara:strand:- start:80 stop:673 length:594 start_codon:yes stop_codon:yes gene_type:complete